jgi:hypothetical protein
MSLIRLRCLPLKTIKLEGNPLCHNFIDSEYYVKVLRTMFHSLMEIVSILTQQIDKLKNWVILLDFHTLFNVLV